MTLCRRVALTVGVVLACLGMPVADAQAQQQVEVPSLAGAAGASVTLPGFWFPAAPSAPVPAPALVLLHGCGGPYAAGSATRLSQRLREYAAWFNAQGIHVLVTDSLTPRGERELCTQKIGTRAVTQADRRRDALGALAWLASRAEVDAARIGLVGWSHGGSAVLAATNAAQRDVQAALTRPSLAVAFYPGCSTDLRGGWRPVAPLLMLVGEADDWTPAAPCKALAARHAEGPGPTVQIEAYADAHHGFDGTSPLRHLPEVPNGVNPAAGVHAGGHAEARRQARERLLRFLRDRWALP